MVGLTEITSFAASVKGVSDMVRGFVSLKSEAEKNAAVIEIQRLLLELQFSALDSASRIEELNAKISEYEDWNKNREYYKLKQTQYGFNFMESTNENPNIVSHMACAPCFQSKEINILQPINGDKKFYRCGKCKDQIQLEHFQAVRVDSGRKTPWSGY
jgi:hypothetical protein